MIFSFSLNATTQSLLPFDLDTVTDALGFGALRKDLLQPKKLLVHLYVAILLLLDNDVAGTDVMLVDARITVATMGLKMTIMA